MKLPDWILEIEDTFNKTTQGDWRASANIPFYIDLQKPSPSLSKHDDKRPTYWSMEDGTFVLASHNEYIPKLLKEIKRLYEEKE